MITEWEYIGDGIYGRLCERERPGERPGAYQFELKTNTTDLVENVIFVQTGEVYDALIAFFNRHLEKDI